MMCLMMPQLGELSDQHRTQLTREPFGALATTDDGERLCKDIISKFLKRVSGTAKYKLSSDRLFVACRHLHNQFDVLLSEATEQLVLAQVTKDRTTLKAAVQGFKSYFTEHGAAVAVHWHG